MYRKIIAIFAFLIIFTTPAAADTGFLWLVNRENPLPADFFPQDLVRFHSSELRAPARDAFAQMLAAMQNDGIHGLKLLSAYRSYAYQQSIFREKIEQVVAKGINPSAANAIAAQSVQLPGASEHQLGLALDVSLDGQLSQEFAVTDAGRWLEENSHYFGFIIRYPQTKTEVTNIIYEPWHLRFVGIPHAQIMKENALTLEEYSAFLAEIHAYIVWQAEGYFLVSFSPEPPPADENTAVSRTAFGENAGYIITKLFSGHSL